MNKLNYKSHTVEGFNFKVENSDVKISMNWIKPQTFFEMNKLFNVANSHLLGPIRP